MSAGRRAHLPPAAVVVEAVVGTQGGIDLQFCRDAKALIETVDHAKEQEQAARHHVSAWKRR